MIDMHIAGSGDLASDVKCPHCQRWASSHVSASAECDKTETVILRDAIGRLQNSIIYLHNTLLDNDRRSLIQ